MDIGEPDPFVEKELRPEWLGAPFAPAGIVLVTAPPAGTRPQLSFRLDVQAPSRGLASGEIAKG
jgi:hypothetical protein